MNVLVLGSGGREHTMLWKIAQSPKVDQLFIAPGNAGTQDVAINLPLAVDDFEAIEAAIIDNQIDLLVIGPELPLVKGIKDFLQGSGKTNVKIVGPGKDGATLEGSKDFAKEFMKEYGIPTANSQTFTPANTEAAISFLDTIQPPYVLKADGLAAGKGVIITNDKSEAKQVIKEMLEEGKFGEASAKVVIEEYLSGIELSVFVLTDGKDFLLLPEAKDYKRIGDNDSGPNTGGMGAVSPVPFANQTFLHKVKERIIKPTITGLQSRGIDYRGFIFIGLMNVNGDPYVIEYNVRMGDPETQVVLPRIMGDFVELLEATASQTLGNAKYQTDKASAVTVVMAAGGYPDKYRKGDEIKGLDTNPDNAIVFQAGTKSQDNKIVTNGGRVLAVTGIGGDINSAIDKAYAHVNQVSWNDAYYRKDIGQDILHFAEQ